MAGSVPGFDESHGETPWDVETAYGDDLDQVLADVQLAADDVAAAVAEIEAAANDDGYDDEEDGPWW